MHIHTVSYIHTHTTCIVPLHELRYQPCAYEIVVNRLAFNSLLSIQKIRSNFFLFLFRRGSFGFFGSTLASSLLFDFFFQEGFVHREYLAASLPLHECSGKTNK